MALTEAQQKQLLNTVINVEAALLKGGPSMNDDGMSVDKSLAQIHHQVDRIRETVTLIKTTVDALVDAVDKLAPPPPPGQKVRSMGNKNIVLCLDGTPTTTPAAARSAQRGPGHPGRRGSRSCPASRSEPDCGPTSVRPTPS
jgi:hypothetical protein